MAIALGAGGVVGADDTDITSYTADTGSDRLLVWLTGSESTAGQSALATDVQYNSVSLTEVAGAQIVDSDSSAGIWYMLDASISAGSHSLVTTYANSVGGGRHNAVMTITGVDQTTPVQDSSFNSQASSLTVSDSVTAVADGFSVAIGNYARGPASTNVISGTGWTARTSYPGASSSSYATGTAVEGSGGTSTATHTVTGAAANRTNYISLVTFAPAGGAPAAVLDSRRYPRGVVWGALRGAA